MKETSCKDIEKFLVKVARSEFAGELTRLIFISKRSFTEQATEYVKIENIVINVISFCLRITYCVLKNNKEYQKPLISS